MATFIVFLLMFTGAANLRIPATLKFQYPANPGRNGVSHPLLRRGF
jgi:hypothetical protein